METEKWILLGFGMMWGFIIKRLIALAPEADKDRAASLPPITLQTGFALGSALSGIIANGLGLGTDISDETMQRIATWIFAGFIPFAVIGNIFAWRFVGSANGSIDKQRGGNHGVRDE